MSYKITKHCCDCQKSHDYDDCCDNVDEFPCNTHFVLNRTAAEYRQGRAEMEADAECDKRREDAMQRSER